MNFDQNADYPGDYSPNPRAPIQFGEQVNPEVCTRIEIIGVTDNGQTVWTYPPSAEDDDDDDDDDDKDDKDDEMDDDDDDEDVVLIVKEDGENGLLLGRVLMKAIYGRVRYASVVRRREIAADAAVGPDTPIGWDKTGDRCAVKEMRHDTIAQLIMQRTENPLKEINAMQYIQQWNEAQQGDGDPHPPTMEQLHVILPRDLLADEEYLYNIMPYLNGSELLVQLGGGRLDEQQGRFWFRQMLNGLRTLQEAHVCHRDLSPENFMVHNGSCLVIDMGMCIRIPYNEDVDPPRRCLITPQHRCGKWRYMSPEIYNEEAFDGHAVDLWAVAVILFIMLIGIPPWDEPTDTQRHFASIVDGGLNVLLTQAGYTPQIISPDAVDLLQRMLFRNPGDRLSLDQILAHPWLTNE